MPRRLCSALFVLLLLGAAVLAAGCRAESSGAVDFQRRERPESGEPRGYHLGFSDVPWTLTEQAYQHTYDMVSHYGEVVLVQRPPSWQDFLPDAQVSDEQRNQTVALREGARGRGLLVAVAVDPFDPTARDRLQGLPATHEGLDLADEGLRHAFVEEARFVAEHVRPDYLVLGTEVNSTFERNPQGYHAFVEAYRDAYDAVKEISPETQVFPSFQYEELLGVVPDLPPHAPRWELLDDFRGKMDLLGITTYPSFAYNVARKVPPQYYAEIQQQTDLPVAFVSAGYVSGEAPDGIGGSTPAEQRRFLERLLADADALGSPLVVWFALRDLSFATAAPYDVLASIGLRDASDRPKESWPAWEEASNRPYDPAAAAERRAQTAPSPTGTPTSDDGEPAGDAG